VPSAFGGVSTSDPEECRTCCLTAELGADNAEEIASSPMLDGKLHHDNAKSVA